MALFGRGRRENKIVVRLGKGTALLGTLTKQFRTLFEPNVSSSLRNEGTAKLKDYMQMSEHFEASHLFAFTQTEQYTNLRVIDAAEKGPTFTFRVLRYALKNAVNPTGRGGNIFRHASILVHQDIKETDRIWRLVEGLGSSCKATHDTSRAVLIKRNLSGTYTIFHYDLVKREKGDAVKIELHELGPRLDLELVKIEEGVCGGEVSYHAHVVKTREEVAAIEERIREREATKRKRREEQEKNVQMKRGRKAPVEMSQANVEVLSGSDSEASGHADTSSETENDSASDSASDSES